jgi:hypothetical protein
MKTTVAWPRLVSVATLASVTSWHGGLAGLGGLVALGGLTGAVIVAAPRPALADEAEAIAKVKDLNKKAVDAYENLEMEEARKFLMTALEMCAAEGLNRNAIKATTHLNLGVVMVGGLKQRDAGTKQFRRALEIDPHIKVPKRLSNPEIQSAFDVAVKGGGAEGGDDGTGGGTKPPAVSTAPPPPAAATSGTLTLLHEPIGEAKAGEALTLRAKVQGGGRFEKVVLAYRPESASDFLARDMDREGEEYVARIPDVATKGASVAYYIEVRGRGGQALARNGSPDGPHVVALTTEGSSGAVADLAASEGLDDTHPGRKDDGTAGHLWLSLGLGVGGGYAKGHPEVNPNYPDPNNSKQTLPIEFSNVAAAKLLHFNPELGYFLSPTLMLSLQGRIQLASGASEVRFETCKPNGVCQPASGAVAVVAKATKLLDRMGPLQPYVSLSAGGGYIRYVVDISSFKLSGCGTPADGSNCFDTVAGGGFLFGPAVGGWLHMTGPVFLTGAVSALIGLPNTAVNVDLNLGLGYRM